MVRKYGKDKNIIKAPIYISVEKTHGEEVIKVLPARRILAEKEGCLGVTSDGRNIFHNKDTNRWYIPRTSKKYRLVTVNKVRPKTVPQRRGCRVR